MSIPSSIVPVSFRTTWWEITVDLRPEDERFETWREWKVRGADETPGGEAVEVGPDEWSRVPVLSEAGCASPAEALSAWKPV